MNNRISLPLMILIALSYNLLALNSGDALKADRIVNEAGAIYKSAILKVTEILKDKPAVPIAKIKLKELKEIVISRLMELGKLRSGLTDRIKREVDKRLELIKRSIDYEIMKRFERLLFVYNSVDSSVGDLIKSYKDILIYVNFELLRKQKPGEIYRIH